MPDSKPEAVSATARIDARIDAQIASLQDWRGPRLASIRQPDWKPASAAPCGQAVPPGKVPKFVHFVQIDTISGAKVAPKWDVHSLAEAGFYSGYEKLSRHGCRAHGLIRSRCSR